MAIFWNITYTNYLWFKTYPIEFISTIAKRVLQIAFMLLLWHYISKSTTSVRTSTEELLAYFICVTAIGDIAMSERFALGSALAKSIKSGEINNILIKPFGILSYLYASTLGKNIPSFIFSMISIVAALFIFPTGSLYFALEASVMVFFAIIISWYLNIIFGTVSFLVTETIHLRYMFQIIIRTFAGAYIPLQYYPEEVRNVLEYTFFPYLLYTPVNTLFHGSDGQFLRIILIMFIWAVIIGIFTIWFWRRLIKKYEAIGI